MKKSICGADCAKCQWNTACPGCSDERCFIAKYIKTGGKEKYDELFVKCSKLRKLLVSSITTAKKN